MIGQVRNVAPNQLTITTEEVIDLHRMSKLANGKTPQIKFEIIDNRRITQDQRGKIFALINDLCNFTGDLPDEWERRFKWMTAREFDLPDFSLSDCSVSTANLMIGMILTFLFEEAIPFKTKTWDSIPDEFPKQWLALRYRKCVLCGRPADIAHANAVGRTSRKLVDHRKLYFMALCREHHTEQHRIGLSEFMKKYHIKPVKLDDDDLIYLGIMTKKRMQEIDGGTKND